MPIQFRYLLALLPPAELIPAIAWYRALAGPMRHLVDDPRLHLTLLAWPLRATADPQLIERIHRLMARLDLSACRVALRRLIVTRAGARLTPVGSCDGLRTLEARLHRGLAEADPVRRTFDPHVTLGYEAGRELGMVVDRLGWRAMRVVLIESHHGLSRYRRLGEWPLIERQGAFAF